MNTNYLRCKVILTHVWHEKMLYKYGFIIIVIIKNGVIQWPAYIVQI